MKQCIPSASGGIQRATNLLLTAVQMLSIQSRVQETLYVA
jgi:hypothetical protein